MTNFDDRSGELVDCLHRWLSNPERSRLHFQWAEAAQEEVGLASLDEVIAIEKFEACVQEIRMRFEIFEAVVFKGRIFGIKRPRPKYEVLQEFEVFMREQIPGLYLIFGSQQDRYELVRRLEMLTQGERAAVEQLTLVDLITTEFNTHRIPHCVYEGLGPILDAVASLRSLLFQNRPSILVL